MSAIIKTTYGTIISNILRAAMSHTFLRNKFLYIVFTFYGDFWVKKDCCRRINISKHQQNFQFKLAIKLDRLAKYFE